MENGIMEIGNFCWFAANGKRKFVFLGRQAINGYRRLLCEQMCPSMIITVWAEAFGSIWRSDSFVRGCRN